MTNTFDLFRNPCWKVIGNAFDSGVCVVVTYPQRDNVKASLIPGGFKTVGFPMCVTVSTASKSRNVFCKLRLFLSDVAAWTLVVMLVDKLDSFGV